MAEATEPATLARQQMQAQFGVVAFVKRAIILHSSKLVALLLFAAAAQGQCALGWLLVGEAPAECPMPVDPKGCSILIQALVWNAAGLVVGAPLLGGPESWTPRRQKLLHASLIAADFLAVCWLVTLYAFQVPSYAALWLHPPG